MPLTIKTAHVKEWIQVKTVFIKVHAQICHSRPRKKLRILPLSSSLDKKYVSQSDVVVGRSTLTRKSFFFFLFLPFGIGGKKSPLMRSPKQRQVCCNSLLGKRQSREEKKSKQRFFFFFFFSDVILSQWLVETAAAGICQKTGRNSFTFYPEIQSDKEKGKSHNLFQAIM